MAVASWTVTHVFPRRCVSRRITSLLRTSIFHYWRTPDFRQFLSRNPLCEYTLAILSTIHYPRSPKESLAPRYSSSDHPRPCLQPSVPPTLKYTCRPPYLEHWRSLAKLLIIELLLGGCSVWRYSNNVGRPRPGRSSPHRRHVRPEIQSPQ